MGSNRFLGVERNVIATSTSDVISTSASEEKS